MPEKKITFEIKEHLGVITRFDSGWNRELNIISWNGGTPKYDLRDWDSYHERMRKGLTLFEDEMSRMVSLYLNHNNQKAVEKGRAIEAQRRTRQMEQRQQYRRAGADEESYQAALPPIAEPAEGEELSGPDLQGTDLPRADLAEMSSTLSVIPGASEASEASAEPASPAESALSANAPGDTGALPDAAEGVASEFEDGQSEGLLSYADAVPQQESVPF